MRLLSDFLQIKKQLDLVIEETAKIYPSQVGNILTDKTVEVPAIDMFMEEYNHNPKEQSKINYHCIRYNSAKGYYDVNDIKLSRAIQFRLNNSPQTDSVCYCSHERAKHSDPQCHGQQCAEISERIYGYIRRLLRFL